MLQADDISRALNQTGAVAVMPTDTVYGLVAKASDEQAVSKLYHLKDRHAKPGTLIAYDIDQLTRLGFKRKYLVAAEQFWPGPVSVIIACSDVSKLGYLTQDRLDIAIRLPSDNFVRQVLKLTGPLLTSSANQPGQPPAETIEQAKQYFNNDVDYYFDGGSLNNRLPSTIIRIIDDAIEVIRQGAAVVDGDDSLL